jgi:hypothetical protein
MTPSKGMFYGVSVLLVALVLLSSSVAAYYYGQYQRESTQAQTSSEELTAALANYKTLSGSFNASLRDYNQTLSVLASVVSDSNTSGVQGTNSSDLASVSAKDLASLWTSYRELAAQQGSKVETLGADILIVFGNGTSRWYNETQAQPGWNAFVMTAVLLQGKVQSVWYPQYGEHLVTGIDGVEGTAQESWFVWVYGGSGWSVASTGADGIQVQNGTVVAWTLCGYDANYNPTCTP